MILEDYACILDTYRCNNLWFNFRIKLCFRKHIEIIFFYVFFLSFSKFLRYLLHLETILFFFQTHKKLLCNYRQAVSENKKHKDLVMFSH